VFIARYTINIHKKCNYTVCCECFFFIFYFTLYFKLVLQTCFCRWIFEWFFCDTEPTSTSSFQIPCFQDGQHLTKSESNEGNISTHSFDYLLSFTAVVKIDFFVRNLDRVSKCRWRLIFSVQYKIYY